MAKAHSILGIILAHSINDVYQGLFRFCTGEGHGSMQGTIAIGTKTQKIRGSSEMSILAESPQMGSAIFNRRRFKATIVWNTWDPELPGPKIESGEGEILL